MFHVQKSLDDAQRHIAETAKITPKPINEIILASHGPCPVMHDGGLPQGWINLMTALLAL